MGYYTYFSLRTDEDDDEIIIEDLITRFELQGVMDINGHSIDSSKWYKHKEEMLEFSKLYPDVVFKLSGWGEDNEDMWKKYFKNGKMQICRAIITFDEYDEEKLND